MDFSTLEEITANFVSELELSQKGGKTSLAFIKNTIPSSPLVKDGETFQVMVIGGTNFFTALLLKKNESLEIQNIQHDTLPPFPTKDDFFTYLNKHLAQGISVLAINFGFPSEPLFVNGKLQGVLLQGAKQSTFTGLLGKNICQEFETYMQDKGRKVQASIANDTICLLLSGKTQASGNNLAAGIVGTGMNFAIFLDSTTLVNLETGNFDKFPKSEFFEIINNEATNPHDHFFEKELSGGYLYKHFNLTLTENNIKFPPLASTEQLSILAEERQDEIGTLAQETLERSAQLVACTVAGIVKFKKSDMTFVMQGSVFWKGYQYKETVAETVKKLSPEYTVNFIKVEHADILGAAKLVT